MVAVALNAPVRSLQMLDLQAAAGATEIYMALRPVTDASRSFDSMPARRDGEPTQVSNQRLVTELIGEAHRRGMRVHFCADAAVVAVGDRDGWMAHVAAGLHAGADSVVVGSLATLGWLTEAPPEVALIVGAAAAVTTVRYARHLHEVYGVSRVVLPHAVTLDEIADFCAIEGLEVEVPVQTGSGLDCRSCRLADQPGVGLGCRAGYRGGTAGATGDLGGFLDGAGDCALCDVPALASVGVSAIQIAGRESPNVRQNAKITQMYRRALDNTAAGASMAETIEAIDRVELMWQMGWVPRLCEQARCRFRDTPARRAYV